MIDASVAELIQDGQGQFGGGVKTNQNLIDLLIPRTLDSQPNLANNEAPLSFHMFSSGVLSSRAPSEIGENDHQNLLEGLPNSFNKAADKRKK